MKPHRNLLAAAILVGWLATATTGCGNGDDDTACNEGTLRCDGDRIEVCAPVFQNGYSVLEWVAVTDCEETEEECTTNAARCGGVGPCCAAPVTATP